VDAVKSLVIVYNSAKEGSVALASEFAARAKRAGRNVRISCDYPVPAASMNGCDSCCVIGGDGTLLSVAGEAAREGVRVMGINMGLLGFMAMFTVSEARGFFDSFLEGDFRTSERSLLLCRSAGGDVAPALNDVVIRASATKMARLRVTADDSKLVNIYVADGLVISTPTGSTAYNLSAGGPLIHPRAPVLAVTPICPHTLSNRSLVVGEGTKLHIKAEKGGTISDVNCDGVPCFQNEASGGMPVSISLAPWRLQLVLRPDYTYFELLHRKLGWSGRASRP
jgi:NAD+ kinase